MNVCYIIGAVPVGNIQIKLNDGDFVIAADLGVENAKKLGVECDVAVGDFDSLGHIPQLCKTIVHPCEKDDTDTMLALKYGISEGYRKFVLLGCIGGRLDHTMANLQTLVYAKNHGALAWMVDEKSLITVLKNESLAFESDFSGCLSLFSVNEYARVSIKGMKYELQNYTITNDFPIGISNEFVGQKAEVSAHDGTIWVIADGNIDKLYKII